MAEDRAVFGGVLGDDLDRRVGCEWGFEGDEFAVEFPGNGVAAEARTDFVGDVLDRGPVRHGEFGAVWEGDGDLSLGLFIRHDSGSLWSANKCVETHRSRGYWSVVRWWARGGVGVCW